MAVNKCLWDIILEAKFILIRERINVPNCDVCRLSADKRGGGLELKFDRSRKEKELSNRPAFQNNRSVP